MKWFRLYSEVLDDPKVQNLSPELFKTWINILCIASLHEGNLPSIKDVSFRLRATLDETKLAFQALTEAGLIHAIKNQHTIGYAPHGWKKRQYISDTSTERVKRFRAVSRNVSETVNETPPEQIQNRTDTEQNRTDYIFQGKIIKLNSQDYDSWKKTFFHIKDFDAELKTADDWLYKKDKKDDWFLTVSRWLNKKHQELAGKQKSKPQVSKMEDWANVGK